MIVAGGAGAIKRTRAPIGERLEEMEPRGVRRILPCRSDARYEIQESTIYDLRVRHTREDRRGWTPRRNAPC